MEDVVIIGAGIVGCATARELSKYNLNVTVLDKNSDISEGTSKANSGLVHAGFDCEPNTLKAILNVKGNEMYTKLCEELDIPFRRNGAFVLCFDEADHNKIEKLYEKATKNQVPDVAILNKEEILKLEPNINENVYSALYAKSAGIISPYEATIAFAENSNVNGVKYKLNTKVTNIVKTDNGYKIETSQGEFETKYIINAAGIRSDEINNLISNQKYELFARKGEYVLFDRSAKGLVDKTIFQLPTSYGKGILVTPTVHNNILIGPSSDDIDNKCDLSTTQETIESVYQSASRVVNNISRRDTITTFSGLRANFTNDYSDFVIEEMEENKGFINAVGINSPGLSAAPAIAEMICDMVVKGLEPQKNQNFISKREGIKIFNELNIEEQNELITKNASYGKIICRCESITEGEIVDAINRPLGATTLDGVKRRTRTSMGRCQGGFCTSKVLEILARENKVDITEVTKFGGSSNILIKG